MDIFVTQLKKAMFLKGWRQIDLVRATGLTDSQISSWYNGRYRPNGEAMAKIAKALGVTVDYLLGKEDAPVSKLTLPQLHEIPVIGKVAAGWSSAATMKGIYWGEISEETKAQMDKVNGFVDSKYSREISWEM